jgi:hypothetical protein
MAVTSFEFMLRLYSLEDTNDTINIETNPYESWKCCMDYEGKTVYTGGDNGKIYQYHAASGDLLADFKSKNENFVSCFATVRISWLKKFLE